MTLAIVREHTTGGFVVHLVGDLDARMAATVAEAITQAREASVVVDLSELNAFDEEGLAALVEAGVHISAEGRSMTVVGARAEVLAAIRSAELDATEGSGAGERDGVRRSSRPRQSGPQRTNR